MLALKIELENLGSDFLTCVEVIVVNWSVAFEDTRGHVVLWIYRDTLYINSV